jgi:hypothetical protein
MITQYVVRFQYLSPHLLIKFVHTVLHVPKGDVGVHVNRYNNALTATIYLIHIAVSATLHLLRVQTEISWSHGTIRAKVHDGTSQ